jgi:hypothetical protein
MRDECGFLTSEQTENYGRYAAEPNEVSWPGIFILMNAILFLLISAGET